MTPEIAIKRVTHECWWCGEETDAIFWACRRCSPLKEEGYRRAADAGAADIASVYWYVFQVMREHGVSVR